jgi:hypothetical protein
MANEPIGNVDDLWGGTLSSFHMDLRSQSAELRIEVLDGDVLSRYRVAVMEVSDLSFRNAIPGPWSYVEVTEARLSPAPDGARLELVLWSEDAVLSIDAKVITVQPQG